MLIDLSDILRHEGKSSVITVNLEIDSIWIDISNIKLLKRIGCSTMKNLSKNKIFFETEVNLTVFNTL